MLANIVTFITIFQLKTMLFTILIEAIGKKEGAGLTAMNGRLFYNVTVFHSLLLGPHKEGRSDTGSNEL